MVAPSANVVRHAYSTLPELSFEIYERRTTPSSFLAVTPRKKHPSDGIRNGGAFHKAPEKSGRRLSACLKSGSLLNNDLETNKTRIQL